MSVRPPLNMELLSVAVTALLQLNVVLLIIVLPLSYGVVDECVAEFSSSTMLSADDNTRCGVMWDR